MNNKIKEILKDIEKGVKTGKDKNDIKIGGICYEWKDLKVLLDYITNLQQENERLKVKTKEQSLLLIDYQDTEQRYNDYKSRCEKAIEYINDILYPIGSCVNGSDLPYESIESLLNILQNGSDSQ